MPAASVSSPAPPPDGANSPWKEALHLATRHAYPKGHLLLLDDGAIHDFYYMEHGRLRITYASKGGQERAMLEIRRGTIFNEASALVGYDNPDTQYLCLADTVLWRFNGGLLTNPDFVREHPHLIINLMRSLGGKTLTMHEQLSYTGTSRALVQLCRYLLRAVENHGGPSFRPDLTQQELADVLGIHRATLVRCVRALRERGILGMFTRRRLDIVNLNALKVLAEEE